MHALNGIPPPAMDQAYQTRERDRITGTHGSALTDTGFPGIPAHFAKTFSNHLARNLYLNLGNDLCQCSHCEVDVLNQEPAHSESAANTYTMRLPPWLRQAHRVSDAIFHNIYWQYFPTCVLGFILRQNIRPNEVIKIGLRAYHMVGPGNAQDWINSHVGQCRVLPSGTISFFSLIMPSSLPF